MSTAIAAVPSASPSSLLAGSHSLCFRHSTAVPRLLSPHSAELILAASSASLPALCRDISEEQNEENKDRRHMHSRLLHRDSGAFRKTLGATAEHFSRKHCTRNLLNEIHRASDPLDIVPHKYTFSRRALPPSVPPSELLTHIEDFIQPSDPSSMRPRSTGYSRGLLRSMVSLESFGPQHSQAIDMQRSVGRLPPSPSTDRNRHLRLDLLGSTTSSIGTPASSPFSPFNNEYRLDSSFLEIADSRTKSRHWHRAQTAKHNDRQASIERQVRREAAAMESRLECADFCGGVDRFEGRLRVLRNKKLGWT